MHLTGDSGSMRPTVALAYRYADAVLHRRTDVAAARDAVRTEWGDRGLIDLAMNMQGARLYPMMGIAPASWASRIACWGVALMLKTSFRTLGSGGPR
jgi:hypothetical protein